MHSYFTNAPEIYITHKCVWWARSTCNKEKVKNRRLKYTKSVTWLNHWTLNAIPQNY